MAADLAALIARLRALPYAGDTIAAEAAPLVLEASQATADAATAPDGTPWAVRKKDGKRALPNAAGALSVSSSGDVIYLMLSGVYVYAQRRRPILPVSGQGIPKRIVDVIRAKAREVLSR